MIAVRLFNPSLEFSFVLLVWQQLFFIFGGILGTRKEMFVFPDVKIFLRGLFYGIGLFLINTITGAFAVEVISRLMGNEVAQRLAIQERAGVEIFLQSSNPFVVVGIMLLLVIGAPLGEELFFRGLLLDGWKRRFGAKKAIFFAALLFAVLHFYILQFIPVLVAGIILGIMFVRTENIFVPIIAHAIVNALVLLVWLASL